MPFPSSLPPARMEDPDRVPVLRWGIAGPGWIAERFADALRAGTNQRLVAIGSRSAERARQFAARWDIPKAHGAIDDLVSDPEVDVVYVATPHNHHLPVALAAIEAGKHVLVEKPLALNAAEGERLRQAARERQVLLIEALWTAFLPKFRVIRQLLADGALGTIHTVVADHGEHFTPDHRIMHAELAGGPMLDLGTYPVAFATMVLGEPEVVQASGEGAPTGVNGQAAMLLGHRGGAVSLLHCTILGHTPCDAFVSGEQGMLAIPSKFYTPGPFTVTANDLTTRLVYEEERSAYRGLACEILHLAACVAEGLGESPIWPVAQSVATLRTMDRARQALGIVFNEERDGGR